jgi:uncharacterized protein YutE (UPF0331/DUF86 family)
MKSDFKKLLDASKLKTLNAIALVEASLKELNPFDPNKQYKPKELEPYDALSDRFVRAIETCIKFFKSYEYYLYTVPSDTYRDLLLNMEKQGIISGVELWVDMRDIRNRIVHDYLPDQIKNIFDLIMTDFKDEVLRVKQKVQSLEVK